MRNKSITKKNISPAIIPNAPWRLTEVIPLPEYQLKVTFVDGLQGIVDMKALILNKNAGVFAKLKDITIFNQVYLEYGAVTWPGEIDLAPDALYTEIKLHGICIYR